MLPGDVTVSAVTTTGRLLAVRGPRIPPDVVDPLDDSRPMRRMLAAAASLVVLACLVAIGGARMLPDVQVTTTDFTDDAVRQAVVGYRYCLQGYTLARATAIIFSSLPFDLLTGTAVTSRTPAEIQLVTRYQTGQSVQQIAWTYDLQTGMLMSTNTFGQDILRMMKASCGPVS